MDFFDILTLAGGLALFLYGMDLMGNSLTLVSGNQLQGLLESLTSNKFKAILLGAGVTAVIQSSSGTTVMVVGLVNSGIMKLTQAIGVIMGANIGTTITAWLLSLTGLTSENFVVQMLKPSSFSPILAIIGVGFILFSKRERRQAIGKILIGFTILIYGMEAMSAAMKPLAMMPEFRSLFTYFSNPILGALAGAVLTALIQSSSASVGILQALTASGLVSMTAAIPLIMGQNIGTCITAGLAAIGAKRNAKRAAMIHLAFNLIGTVIFMALFYSAAALFDFSFYDRQATTFTIAAVHTVFNVLNTVILMNFTGLLSRIAYFFIPETDVELQEKQDDFQVLDDRLLDTPAVALRQTWLLSITMFELSERSIKLAMQLYDDGFDHEVFGEVRRLEKRIDRYQDRLGGYLLKIGERAITNYDNQTVTIILNSINDIERISDHALSLALDAKKMYEDRLMFSSVASNELKVYADALREVLDLTIGAYRQEDTEQARLVEPLEEAIDRIDEAIKIRHIDRLRQGVCSVEMGLLLTDVCNAMERVSDHCSNIAIALIEIRAGVYDAHKYLRKIHKRDGNFQPNLDYYLDKYTLPDLADEVESCEIAVPMRKVPEGKDHKKKPAVSDLTT